MAMTDDELYQTVVGLFALAHREVREGTFFETDQGTESMLALFRDLNRFDFTYSGQLASRSDADIRAAIHDAASSAARQVGADFLRALGMAITAFAAFCRLVSAEAPDIDLEAVLQRLALEAALPTSEQD